MRTKKGCLLCRKCDVSPGRRYCRLLARDIGPHSGRRCKTYSADTERVAWPEAWDAVAAVDDIIGGVRIA